MYTVVENIDRIRRESSVKGGCNVLNLPTIGLGYWVSLRISHIFKLFIYQYGATRYNLLDFHIPRSTKYIWLRKF